MFQQQHPPGATNNTCRLTQAAIGSATLMHTQLLVNLGQPTTGSAPAPLAHQPHRLLAPGMGSEVTSDVGRQEAGKVLEEGEQQ